MEPIKILIVEDDAGDVALLKAYLEPVQTETFELIACEWLKDAQKHLENQHFNLILLDLSLPDSKGIDTFRAIIDQVPKTPIVILSGLTDQALALQAVQLGAQDYLTKDQVNSQILVRSIHHAIERQRLLLQAGQAVLRTQHERDLQLLENLPSQQSLVTARLYSSASLMDSQPEAFEQLVRQYGRLLDLALQQRMYQLETSLSGQALTLAEELAFLRVGPRDVIEIHTASVQRKTISAPSEKANAYLEESRFLVLELMGHLVAYYRRYCVKVNQPRKR